MKWDSRASQSRPFGFHLALIWRPFDSCLDFDFDVGSLGMNAVTSEMRFNSDRVVHLNANESLSAGDFLELLQMCSSKTNTFIVNHAWVHIIYNLHHLFHGEK